MAVVELVPQVKEIPGVLRDQAKVVVVAEPAVLEIIMDLFTGGVLIKAQVATAFLRSSVMQMEIK